MIYFFLWSFGLWANTLPSRNKGIVFIENKGQWDQNILFRADIPTGKLFVEAGILTYVFEDKASLHELLHGKTTGKSKFHAVKLKFGNAAYIPTVVKEKVSPIYYNYYKGAPEKWASHVQAFQQITLKNIYPGIHLELLTKGDAVKLNYIIEPGANPNQIQLVYEGADRLKLKQNGLQISTSLGEIIEEAPYAYQQIGVKQNNIPCSLVLKQNMVTFKVGNYQHQNQLVIDPTQIFGSYIGSIADNFGFSATYDKDGNVYGAGTVYDYTFPSTAGAYDLTFNEGFEGGAEFACDVFVSKFNADGSSLLFATYLGGQKNEQPYSLVVNPNNELLVLGSTGSTNFPTTPGTFDNTHNGFYDLFVSKFNSDGTSLVASTYMGGDKDDGINGQIAFKYSTDFPLAYNYADCFRSEIICDNLGNVYFASTTQSQNFTSSNAAQNSFGGGNQDGIVVKMNANLNRVLFSTFLGGAKDDAAYALCLDAKNNLFVCGSSNSTTIPNIKNNNNGLIDGILAKYNANSGALQQLVFHGTAENDQHFFVQTDLAGYPYVLGQTEGILPHTANTYHNEGSKQFISKFDFLLDTTLVQGCFGSNAILPNLVPAALMIDDCGKIYISGWGGIVNENFHLGTGNVNNFPLSADAFQTQTDGSDFYFAVFAKNMVGLNYASYYGGKQSNEHVDGGSSRFDKKGIIYQSVCAGCGGFSDFPTTQNAHSRNNPAVRPNRNEGGCNLAIFKFDARPVNQAPEFNDTLLYLTAGDTLNFAIQVTDKDADLMQIQLEGNLIGLNPAKIKLTDTLSTFGSLKAWLHFYSNCTDHLNDTFVITVKVFDAACPNSLTTTRKIKILVLAPGIEAPVLTCVSSNSNNSILLKWGQSGELAVPNQIQIFKKVNNGKFNLLSTTSQNQYLDPNNGIQLSNSICYKLVGINNCGIPSDSSNELCFDNSSNEKDRLAFTNLDTITKKIQVFDTLDISFTIASNFGDSVYANLLANPILKNPIAIQFSRLNSGINCNIRWIPICENINNDTLNVLIGVSDNQCPFSNLASKLIQLVVKPLPKLGIGEMACANQIADNKLVLNWTKLPNSNYVKSIHVLEKVNGGKPKEVAVLNQINSLSYTLQQVFDWNQNYCYAVFATDVCDFPGDTSDEYCTKDIDKLLFPPPFNFVTVQNDQEIVLNWNPLDSNNFGSYIIEKKVGRTGNTWTKLSARSNYKDTLFTDKSVNVDDSSYCYRMSVANKCGAIGGTGKEVCSILLKGTVYPFEYHDLSWLPYTYFITGTNRFELYKSEPGIYESSLLAIRTNSTLQYQDRVLNPDNGLYHYTVAAFEKGFGQGFASWSNTIELVQPPSLFVPNAVTANGDQLNDVIKTVHVFVKTYQIKMYNRWGELIWESKDKYASMPATYLNKPLATDVYFYEINYTGWDDQLYTKKGNISILR